MMPYLIVRLFQDGMCDLAREKRLGGQCHRVQYGAVERHRCICGRVSSNSKIVAPARGAPKYI